MDGFTLDHLPVLQNFQTVVRINVDKADHII